MTVPAYTLEPNHNHPGERMQLHSKEVPRLIFKLVYRSLIWQCQPTLLKPNQNQPGERMQLHSKEAPRLILKSCLSNSNCLSQFSVTVPAYTSKPSQSSLGQVAFKPTLTRFSLSGPHSNQLTRFSLSGPLRNGVAVHPIINLFALSLCSSSACSSLLLVSAIAPRVAGGPLLLLLLLLPPLPSLPPSFAARLRLLSSRSSSLRLSSQMSSSLYLTHSFPAEQ